MASSMGRYRAVTAREAAYNAKHSWSSRATLGAGRAVIARVYGASCGASLVCAPEAFDPTRPDPPAAGRMDRMKLSGTDSTLAPLESATARAGHPATHRERPP